MCVIMTAELERPTREEMEQAAEKNPDGAGLAWIEDGTVRFEKVGAEPSEIDRIITLAEKAPLPFVVHFRITSSGPTAPELSHPFPLRRKNPLAVNGSSGQGVLFHNGTWPDWRPYLLSTAASTGVAVGGGPMSDTRTMAYLATVLGKGILETIPENNRIVVLTPKGLRRYGKGWSEYAEGLFVSNTLWVPKTREVQPSLGWQGPKPQVITGPTVATDDRKTTMVKGIPRLVKDAGKNKGKGKKHQERWVG